MLESDGRTRRDRSPAAISDAVCPIRSSGRRPILITITPSAISARITPTPTSTSTMISRCNVWSTSRSGTATSTVRPP